MICALKETFFCMLFLLTGVLPGYAADSVGIWRRLEQSFTSSKEYANPLYDVRKFSVKLISPSGRIKNINGFWDGGRSWKMRFAPDEKGTCTWESTVLNQLVKYVFHSNGGC
jgi:hypothetical protein